MGALDYVCEESGELMDVDEMIAIQQSQSDTLIGLAYSNPANYLKLKTAFVLEADVITLGTSRVMQFSERYFSTSFYNTGGGVSGNFDEYTNFLENLEVEYEPEVIILGLDSWIFNSGWRGEQVKYDEFISIEKSKIGIGDVIFSMLSDYGEGKWNISDLYHSKQIGMNAIENGDGFRADGTYRYNNIIRNYETNNAIEHQVTIEYIENGTKRFQYGDSVDMETVDELDELLKYCNAREIEVVAIIPPFAPVAWDLMQVNGNHQYMQQIYNTCSALFAEYEYELYDMQDIAFLGVDDGYFIDGFHGSDVAYALMCQHMISEGSILGEYIDEDQLHELIENRYSNLELENLY